MPESRNDRDLVLPVRPGRRGRAIAIACAIGVILLFIAAHNGVPLFTDWLWFREVGYARVFATVVVARTGMYLVGAILFFVLVCPPMLSAWRHLPERTDAFLAEHVGGAATSSIIRGARILLIGFAAFAALWAGRVSSEHWSDALQFVHAVPFGRADPVFGHDVSFYLFRLPILRYAWSFAASAAAVAAIGAGAMHVVAWLTSAADGEPTLTVGARRQLFAFGAVAAAIAAVGTTFASWDLLTADNGVFTGAGYVDIHYRLPGLHVQGALLVVVAVACVGAMAGRLTVRHVAMTAGLWACGVVIAGWIVPGAAQSIRVDPNQLALETGNIRRNITFTRAGFGLNAVQQIDTFPADESLTASGLASNRQTLDNIRLWDYPFLGRVYDQTQTVKKYYSFRSLQPDGSETNNVDVDRYVVDGKIRQVMLAARELDTNGLSGDARTWQNERLGYTHGYGIVMSPVNESDQAAPTYFIQGFPPVTSAAGDGIHVTEPRIYFGLLSDDYVLVDSAQREFDPSQEVAAAEGEASYHGRAGVRIGNSMLRRLAYAVQFGDQNILLAGAIRSRTRMVYRRDVRNRVRTIAPFLQQDSDPYLVVTTAGRLVWMIDCYTVADGFPYSTPAILQTSQTSWVAPNYVRNSVKATVDAYDGTVSLYLFDTKDPIAQTYSRMFPGLFRPSSAMPADLQRHIRYPEDLFRMQRSVYAQYHVDDPGVFYRKEDAWAAPADPSGDQAGPTDQPAARGPGMEPYYVVMRLPDAQPPAPSGGEEFLLMSPLAPYKQEDRNILGWMCARCDQPNYGRLVLYRFPQGHSVEGPTQVVALINSDTVISRELSLWRSNGSNATLGNLLVIPIESSLLYVAPLYVESTNSARIPQLQRVVVAFGQRVVMDNSLAGALAKLFPGAAAGSGSATAPPPPTGTAAPTSGTASPQTLIDSASREFDAAQSQLRQGDFAGYGEHMRRVRGYLSRLKTALQGPAGQR